MKPDEERLNNTSPKRKAGSADRRHSPKKGARRQQSSGSFFHKKPSGHVIFLIVFTAILLFTILRLFIWNIGEDTGYDPSETTTEFDVELMDYLQPLDPEMRSEWKDDGTTTILALGNDPLSDDRSDAGLAALMEKATDSTIYNGAFPGSTISMKNTEFQNDYPLDGVSLYWVAAALVNQNFDLMDAIVPGMDSEAAAALETLKSVDLSTVDDLVIFYDLQDYKEGRTVYDENNHKNLNTVYGALTATVKLFQENFPHIRIYLMSQPYGTFTAPDGKTADADKDDFGNGTLVDYLNWEADACRTNGISFIDTYYGAVTVEDTDCLTDGYHLNEKGRRKVAERFASVFKE